MSNLETIREKIGIFHCKKIKTVTQNTYVNVEKNIQKHVSSGYFLRK